MDSFSNSDNQTLKQATFMENWLRKPQARSSVKATKSSEHSAVHELDIISDSRGSICLPTPLSTESLLNDITSKSIFINEDTDTDRNGDEDNALQSAAKPYIATENKFDYLPGDDGLTERITTSPESVADGHDECTSFSIPAGHRWHYGEDEPDAGLDWICTEEEHQSICEIGKDFLDGEVDDPSFREATVQRLVKSLYSIQNAPKAWYQGTPAAETPFVLAAHTMAISRDDWIVDSGANVYICNDKKWFDSLDMFHTEVNTAGQGTGMPIAGGGTVSLMVQDGDGEPFKLSLSEVAYAPTSRCNLLSLSKLARAGVHGNWVPGGETMNLLSPDNFHIATADLENGLYHVRLSGDIEQTMTKSTRTSIAPLIANVDLGDPVWKEHRRLGHLSLDRMRRLCAQSAGMRVTADQIKARINEHCPICSVSKAVNRIPRDPANRRFEKIGDLIHVDIWGPYNTIAWDGTRYFCFVTDDASRFTWALRLKSRNEAPDAIRDWHRKLEKKLNVVIQRYRSDNEFSKGPFKHWCDKKGILIEATAPYAHHQVGVAERANRTLREGASSIIHELSVSGQVRRILEENGGQLMRNTTLSEDLWAEAIQHSTWLKSRSPTSALKWKETPWEKTEGQQPNLDRELIWGTRVYVPTTEEERKARGATRKLHDPRGWIGYFMGLENESTYRVWNPDRRQVQLTTNLRVHDGEGLEDSHENGVPIDNDRGDAISVGSTDQVTTNSEDSDGQEKANTVGESKRRKKPAKDTGTVSKFFLGRTAMITTRSKAGQLQTVRDDEELDSDFDPGDYGDAAGNDRFEHHGPLESDHDDYVGNDEEEDDVFQNAEDGHSQLGGTDDDGNQEGQAGIDEEPHHDEDIVSIDVEKVIPKRKKGKASARQMLGLTSSDESDYFETMANRTPSRPERSTSTPKKAPTTKARTARKNTVGVGCTNEHCAETGPNYSRGPDGGLCQNCYQRWYRCRKTGIEGDDWKTLEGGRSRQGKKGEKRPRRPVRHSASEESDIDRPMSKKRDESKRGTRLKANVPDRDRCQVCFDYAYNCRPVEGGKCEQCQKKSRICIPVQLQDDGSLPNTRKHCEVPVIQDRLTFEEYCWPCARKRHRCDAIQPVDSTRPCSYCRTNNFNCIPQEQKRRMETTPKCTACIHRRCDRLQPCDQCKNRNKAKCTYETEKDIRWVTHLLNPISPAQATSDTDPNIDRYVEGEVLECTERRQVYWGPKIPVRVGGPPCRMCVKYKRVRCRRWIAPGVRESVATWKFKWDENTNQVVEDETLTKPPSKVARRFERERTKEPEAMRDTSDSEDTSVGPDDEGEDNIWSEEYRSTARERLRNIQLPTSFLTAVSLAAIHEPTNEALRWTAIGEAAKTLVDRPQGGFSRSQTVQYPGAHKGRKPSPPRRQKQNTLQHRTPARKLYG